MLEALRHGDAAGAIASYGGDLLPGTESPALVELGEYVAVAMREAAHVRDLMHHGHGPALIQAQIESEDTPRVLPTRDGHEMRLRFTQALKG